MDAKRADTRFSELLKEIERFKKSRKATEAFNWDHFGKNAHLTADLEVSRKAKDCLRTKVVRSEKLTASHREQIISQKAKASDFKEEEKRGKEANL